MRSALLNKMKKHFTIFLSIVLFSCSQPEPPGTQAEPNYYAICNLESLYDLKYIENVDSITCLFISTTESKSIPIILKSIGKTKVKYLNIFTDSLIINDNIEIQGLTTLILHATRYSELKGSIASNDLDYMYLSYLNVHDSNFLKDKKLRSIQLFCDSNGIPGFISSVGSIDILNIDGYFENETDLASIKNVKHNIGITNQNKNVHLSEKKLKKILEKQNSPDVEIYIHQEIE